MANSLKGEFVQIVRRHLPHYFIGARVIEMGSLDINGSVRGNFTGGEYVGVDLGPGPGVDLVSAGHELREPSGSYDCAISANCFEHNPYWLETFTNMLRLTRPGGLVVFTCASTGYREHGTRRSAPEASPITVQMGWDYYRNLVERDFTKSVNLSKWCSDWRFFRAHETYCLYFIGLRSGAVELLPEKLVDEVRGSESWCRSAKAIKRSIKVALFGNFLSSPISYYLLGRR